MYFDKKKQCFVADDGSKLKLTESLVNKYPTFCDHSHSGDKEEACIIKRVARYHNYLRRELGIK